MPADIQKLCSLLLLSGNNKQCRHIWGSAFIMCVYHAFIVVYSIPSCLKRKSAQAKSNQMKSVITSRQRSLINFEHLRYNHRMVQYTRNQLRQFFFARKSGTIRNILRTQMYRASYFSKIPLNKATFHTVNRSLL